MLACDCADSSLSWQHLSASGKLESFAPDSQIEINALDGSLTMMSQVLTDVLDLNRFEAGKFGAPKRAELF